ncbi:MAG: hypothetical protein N3F04_06805 [Candidatus Nezhaarchaeota archaeon]|nr:hypothetical protein [Candidatus Nezhaarchaeota archaeon]MCX8142451.1 hypothetical protein [Candidatus Nezhaarchaeota archaeon]MDW8050576.1 hypothetical protein [Nitrososphaerota archaeon]
MRIDRRGCSLKWNVAASSKGVYSVHLTFYSSNGRWRVKREIRLQPKRADHEITLFIEDYDLLEFQEIMESCQSMITLISSDSVESCLNLASRASAIINALISELRSLEHEERS